MSLQVTVHRVVNIVDRRNGLGQPRSGQDYDRGFMDDHSHGGSRIYQDSREYHNEGNYSQSDRRYYEDKHNFGGNFRRSSSPPRNVSHPLVSMFWKINSMFAYFIFF